MSDFSRTENMSGATMAVCMLREAEAWSNAQCELASGLGTIWTEWLKRQREAIEASARSLQQVFECRNLADFAQIQQQWLAETTRRTTTDVAALVGDTAAALTWWSAATDRAGGRGGGLPVRSPARTKSAADEPAQRAAAE